MSASVTPHHSLAVACRDDLEVSAQSFRGELVYILGDPLGLEYHRLNEQEYHLLNWLDGRRSAQEIQQLFNDKFAPYQVQLREIEHYLAQFYQQNLLQSLAGNVGVYLYRRDKKQRWTKRWNKVKSVLAIRFRGFNPEFFFQRLTPYVGWFFGPVMMMLGCLLLLSALVLVTVHWGEFQSRLPRFEQFFSPRNWLAVGLVVLVTKTLHELGHGIVLTKYGGRCHELGLSLLLLIPTLYVNASSAWKFPNKWHRMAVSAAGMYVEMLLAASATFVWWYSQPGMIHYTALNIMVTCTLSSLLLNGNPLMRYDGYYILSDWLEIPNLQQRANRFCRDVFLKQCLGLAEDSEFLASPRTRRILLAYGLAAYLYRFVIVYAIAFMLSRTLAMVGLQRLALWMTSLSSLALLAMPLLAIAKYLRQPGRLAQINWEKRWLVPASALLFIVASAIVPLPATVTCQFVIQPKELCGVFAPQDAVLCRLHVAGGQLVTVDQHIASLRDIATELEVQRLQGDLSALKKQLANMRHHDDRFPEDWRVRAELRGKIESTEATLQEYLWRMSQLEIKAVQAGVIIPYWQEASTNSGDFPLEAEAGWTLAAERIGTTVRRGQLLCRIGAANHWQARLVIPQADIQRIQVGQTVRLLSDAGASTPITSRIAELSRQNVAHVSRALTLSLGGAIEAQRTPASVNQGLDGEDMTASANSVFQATVELPAHAENYGHRGTARIRVGYEPALIQLHRQIVKLFRVDLIR